MATSNVPDPAISGEIVSSSVTDHKMLTCSYTCKISDFSRYSLKPREKINSPPFHSETDDNIKWCLSLYPGGHKEEYNGYVSIQLTLLSSYKTNIRVSHSYFIVKSDGSKHTIGVNKESTLLQRSNNQKPNCAAVLIARSMIKDKDNGLLPDDCLTILCELSALTIVSKTNGNNLLPERWGCTHLNVEQFSYTWTITNFTFCQEQKVSIVSPTFSIGDSSKLKWKLLLYPNGHDEISKDRITVKLLITENYETDVHTMVKMYMTTNAHNDTLDLYNSSKSFTYPKEIKAMDCDNFSYLYRDHLFKNVTIDTLTIICEVRYVTNIISTSGVSKPKTVKIPFCRLHEDLEGLLEQQEFSDVTIIVGDKELKAHKAILAARSSVFSVMFRHDMEERRKNRVEISDIDYEAIQEMLRYLYTGKVKNLQDLASGLLMAAEKYDLEKLKAMCEEELCSSLEIENAIDILILAEQYNAKQLMPQAIQFIIDHEMEMMNNARYTMAFVSHPQLMVDIARQRLLKLKI